MSINGPVGIPPHILAIMNGQLPGMMPAALPPNMGVKAPLPAGGAPPSVAGTSSGGVAGVAPKTGLAGFGERLNEAFSSPMGQFGLNLLAQSGPSLMPRSTGQMIGQAGLQSLQAQNTQTLQDAQRRLLEAKIQQANRASQTPTNTNVQSQFITEDGKLGFLRRNGDVVVTEQDVKDSFDFQQNPDGSRIAVNRSNPNEIVPVVSRDEARSGAEFGAATDRRIEAQQDLPAEEVAAERNLDLLNRIKNHSGLSGAVGVKGVESAFGLRDAPLGGTDEADFVSLVDQVSGSAFLEAFQDLKGGGHITEIEGLKAEQAISRLRDRNQSEAAYKRAIEDLESVIKSGLEQKRKSAGQTDEFEGFSIKR